MKEEVQQLIDESADLQMEIQNFSPFKLHHNSLILNELKVYVEIPTRYEPRFFKEEVKIQMTYMRYMDIIRQKVGFEVVELLLKRLKRCKVKLDNIGYFQELVD